MKKYILIAGVNGTGKSSFRGVLEGQGMELGHIVDPDAIAKLNKSCEIAAGKQALKEIDNCLSNGKTLTQETTLSGHRIKRTIAAAKNRGYCITLYYIGLNTYTESITRIVNRVKKGGHNIPDNDVKRRFEKRFDDLNAVLKYCDSVVFYDNENGFIKVAEIKHGSFRFTNGYRPEWIVEFASRYTLHIKD